MIPDARQLQDTQNKGTVGKSTYVCGPDSVCVCVIRLRPYYAPTNGCVSDICDNPQNCAPPCWYIKYGAQ